MPLVTADFGNGPQQVWQNDDGTYWSPEGTLSGTTESVRPDQQAAFAKNQYDTTNKFYSENPQAYSQLTAEQAAKIKELSFGHSAAELNAYMDSIRPSNPNNIHGNGLYGNGNDMWFGPAPGPQHNDTGPEQAQTAWNDMRNGALIMSLPFAWAGGAALLGGEAAAGAGAGAAGAGSAAAGTEAGAGTLYAGETAAGVGSSGAGLGGTGGAATGMGAGAAGAAESGVLSGSAGSESLVGSAGSDTAAGTGAFDTSASQGVFDAAGNPLYESPSVLQYAQGLAAQYGITPASALSFIKNNAGLFGGLLGAGAAAVGGGAKPAGTTTTTQDVPDWLKPYVVGNINSAQSVLNGINPNNPLLGASQDEAMKTVQGGYLDPNTNPYLKDTYNQGAKAVTDSYLSTTQPRNDALFSKAGAFGNGNSAYMETVARNQFGLGNNLKDLATNVYGGNYQQERSRQAAMTASAPQFVAQQNDAKFSPFKSFQTLFPNISATSTPYFSNPIGNAFSGGLAGYGLSKAFG